MEKKIIMPFIDLKKLIEDELEVFIGINVKINNKGETTFVSGFVKPKDGNTKAKVKKNVNKQISKDMTEEKSGTKVF